jgi:ubiquinone/menaquinone biosynthesis C-methylase UbiE
MSFYERYVLPNLIHLAMRNRALASYRSAIVGRARGTVLEVGVGSGANLPYYGASVEQLYALEPSPPLLARARDLAQRMPFAVELLPGRGEALPLADASVDTVVVTFTLCTIAGVQRSLHEMRRVLRPGGSVLFAEHGLAPDRRVARWQHRLNPLWRPLAGGCNLDRDIAALLRGANFRIAKLDTGYARGPRFASFIYAGEAAPA